jgi:hypothetical protein
MSLSVDFEILDLIRIRLANATSRDVAVLQQQLGLPTTAPEGEADILVRFCDPLPDESPLGLLGNWEAGFSSTKFWILRGNHGLPVAVHIPFDKVGTPCEILCRPSIPALPLLIPILNLTALAKGWLPLHGSAFRFQGKDVLVTGWSKGGKTEALLGFAEHGATYVGDEWVYIDAGGNRLFGVPEPIKAWDWHLDSSWHRSRLTAKQRRKLAIFRLLHGLAKPFAGQRFPATKNMHRLTELIRLRRQVLVSPKQMFGDRIQAATTCPQEVFFMASHTSSAIEVRPMPSEEIAVRMAASLEDEFADLNSWYRQYRFALPERSNPLLDQLPALLRERLSQVFQNKQGLAVWHPYPVSPRELYRAMSPFVSREPSLESSCPTTCLAADA